MTANFINNGENSNKHSNNSGSSNNVVEKLTSIYGGIQTLKK